MKCPKVNSLNTDKQRLGQTHREFLIGEQKSRSHVAPEDRRSPESPYKGSRRLFLTDVSRKSLSRYKY